MAPVLQSLQDPLPTPYLLRQVGIVGGRNERGLVGVAIVDQTPTRTLDQIQILGVTRNLPVALLPRLPPVPLRFGPLPSLFHPYRTTEVSC